MVVSDLEKRVFQRMVIDKPVIATIANEQLKGICRDLSANGMSIEVDKGQVKEGSAIGITLSAGDDRVPPLEATANVVRIIASEVPEKEILGIEFLTVS